MLNFLNLSNLLVNADSIILSSHNNYMQKNKKINKYKVDI